MKTEGRPPRRPRAFAFGLLTSFVLFVSSLRCLPHAHKGGAAKERAERTFTEFAGRKRFEVVKAMVKHQQYAVRRAEK